MEGKRGKLIVIDGIDGSGKTLQTRMLLDRLKGDGYVTATLDFPQYDKNFFGALVGEYLRGEFGEVSDVHPKLASVLYAADRWESSSKIKEWLLEEKIIVLNRYVSANQGHQGGKIKDREKRKVFMEWLDKLEHEIFKIPKPDLNILLKLNPEVAQFLVDKKSKEQRRYLTGKRDIHEASLQHLRDTLECFLELAEQNPETWRVVDCNDYKNKGILNPEVIYKRVWEHAHEFLTR